MESSDNGDQNPVGDTDGTKIVTAGLDPDGNRFSRHDSSWRTGTNVGVIATENNPRLSCDKCSVRILD